MRRRNVGEKEVHTRPLDGEWIYKWNREGEVKEEDP